MGGSVGEISDTVNSDVSQGTPRDRLPLRCRPSEGPPVLVRRVRELLDGPLSGVVSDYVLEIGGGAYLVRLR